MTTFEGKAFCSATLSPEGLCRDDLIGEDGLFSLKDENGNEYERVFIFLNGA